MREARPRTDDVAEGVDGEEEADPDNLHGLEDHVHLAEAGQSLVPHAGQQLLHIGVSNKLKQQHLIKLIDFSSVILHMY